MGGRAGLVGLSRLMAGWGVRRGCTGRVVAGLRAAGLFLPPGPLSCLLLCFLFFSPHLAPAYGSLPAPLPAGSLSGPGPRSMCPRQVLPAPAPAGEDGVRRPGFRGRRPQSHVCLWRGGGGHKEGRRGRLVASCSPFSLEETPRPKHPRSALGTMPSACCWTRPVGATLCLPPRRGPCPSLSLRISPPPASQPLRLPILTPQHSCCALASRWPPGSTVPETPALEPTCQPRLLLSVTAAEISPRACVFSCLFTYPGRQNGGGGPVAPPSCLRNQEDRGSVLPLQTEPSPAPLPAHCGLGRPTASRSSVSPSGGGGAT